MNKLFINGQFVKSNSTNQLAVINPVTEEIIDTVTLANEHDTKNAIKGAKEAQLKWEQVNIVKRAKIVQGLAEQLEKNKNDLAEIYVEEQGKPLYAAIGEIEKSIEYINYMSSLARKNNGEVLQSEVENETIILTKKPVGTTAGIIPWNAPIFVLIRKLIPALVTGCSIVIKPSEETPFGAFKIAEYIQETTIPNGLVQIITGTGSEVGNLLSQNEDIDLISITGSTGAGKSVMESAAHNVKGVNLELGGKAPAIVTKNADIEKAASYIVQARINNSGQVCTCPERIYVAKDIFDEFVTAVKNKMNHIQPGDPYDETTTMGPIINQKQLESINEKVQNAVREGATIELGGHIMNRQGFFYEPTILTNLSKDSIVMKEEIFGPVLPIVSFEDFEEVLDEANTSDYGLSSYIFTESLKEAMLASERLKFGEVYVNCEAEEAIVGYHAGWRQSGLGGADGVNGFDEYLNTTVTYIRYE
ncbi:aldehyde dehydrogenase [Staphylococcus durrellii]|uniref:aldehyde dehydrogenase n=1 Tax=Staphylococcus durrellii TaxID=2781773 RepID=UPI00189CA41D|nr:aldehyde dehydrogenase [Staphylococcus durrellii]MBF7018105.1 aldehyde dehydrogenase [Staphylococcus durrellii]